MLRARRPSVAELEAMASSVGAEALTYDAVGATAAIEWPEGYRHDRYSIDIGPADVFDAAAERLRRWPPHRGAQIGVGRDRSMMEGANVALAAPMPVGFVLATCRVVCVHDNDGCFAWAYGTLPLHPESGEERFAVVSDEDLPTSRSAPSLDRVTCSLAPPAPSHDGCSYERRVRPPTSTPRSRIAGNATRGRYPWLWRWCASEACACACAVSAWRLE